MALIDLIVSGNTVECAAYVCTHVRRFHCAEEDLHRAGIEIAEILTPGVAHNDFNKVQHTKPTIIVLLAKNWNALHRHVVIREKDSLVSLRLVDV